MYATMQEKITTASIYIFSDLAGLHILGNQMTELNFHGNKITFQQLKLKQPLFTKKKCNSFFKCKAHSKLITLLRY